MTQNKYVLDTENPYHYEATEPSRDNKGSISTIKKNFQDPYLDSRELSLMEKYTEHI